MLHYLFALIVLVHGLIHLMCYTHDLQLTERKELASDNILFTKGAETLFSVMWFVPYLLFVATMILFMLYINSWWIIAFIGVLLSQILIILDWREAKYGTIGNVLIMLVILAAYSSPNFIS